MAKHEFRARVRKSDGVVIPLDWESQQFRNDLLHFVNRNSRDGVVQVTLTTSSSKQRSLQQNRYLFGVVYEHIKHYLKDVEGDTQTTIDDIHACMMSKFSPNRTRTIVLQGESLEVPVKGSSAAMDTQEFSDYIERIRAYWAHVDLIIPSPNEQ
jgi:hypothetical protein